MTYILTGGDPLPSVKDKYIPTINMVGGKDEQASVHIPVLCEFIGEAEKLADMTVAILNAAKQIDRLSKELGLEGES